MRLSTASFLTLLLQSCPGCPGGGPGPDEDTGDDTGTGWSESDCDGFDDDGNGVIDDGAADGWATDSSRWSQVLTLPVAEWGTWGLDLIAHPDGDGVYVVAGEQDEDWYHGALVIYHYAADGSLTEVGRHVGAHPMYLTHGSIDPSGRIWVSGDLIDGDGHEPYVVRWDPADGSVTVLLDEREDEYSTAMGSVEATDDGAWLTWQSNPTATDSGAWTNGWLDEDGNLTVLDTWELVEREDSFDGPWTGRIAPDGTLWSAGQGEDLSDLNHGIIRRGTGADAETVYETHIHADDTVDWYEGYTDLQFDGAGNWYASHLATHPTTESYADWRLVVGAEDDSVDPVVIDQIDDDYGAWALALHPNGIIYTAGGSYPVEEGVGYGIVRAGTAADGFADVLQTAPDTEGNHSWSGDVIVDAEGVVWALEIEVDYVNWEAPSATRLHRLSCR